MASLCHKQGSNQLTSRSGRAALQPTPLHRICLSGRIAGIQSDSSLGFIILRLRFSTDTMVWKMITRPQQHDTGVTPSQSACLPSYMFQHLRQNPLSDKDLAMSHRKTFPNLSLPSPCPYAFPNPNDRPKARASLPPNSCAALLR